MQLRDPKGVDDDIAQEQSISLADVLERHDLCAKKRLLLAYILARSFWQFYNSDWMGNQWTTETVQFFRERDGEDDDDEHHNNVCLLEESPYVALSFQKDDSLLSAEYLATEYVVHRYPRVLALGTMLLEIGRRKRRKKTTPGHANDEVKTIEEKISNYLNDIRSTLRRKTWPELGLQEEVQQTYRIIVNNCSDPKLFDIGHTNSLAQENEVLTIEERRAILYKSVISPLKKLLEKLEWIDKSGNIQRQDGVEDSRIPTAFLNAEQASNVSQRGFVAAMTPALDIKHLLLTDSNSFKAQLWLLKIQNSPVTKDLCWGFVKNPSLERIRIAVLDTGFDPAAAFFKDPDRKRRVREWKDYVGDESRTREDEDGHGTHVLSLLMKVAPAANFYVVRVARDTQDLANSTSNIAKV